jgi:hypothetical protein
MITFLPIKESYNFTFLQVSSHVYLNYNLRSAFFFYYLQKKVIQI